DLESLVRRPRGRLRTGEAVRDRRAVSRRRPRRPGMLGHCGGESGAEARCRSGPVRLGHGRHRPRRSDPAGHQHASLCAGGPVHLAAYPYAVYRALQGEGQEVADAEEAERLKQIEQVLAETSRLCTELGDENLPVVVCGDFNTPATGDWAARSDRPDIAWRAPDALVEAGFVDTFRAVHPDPVTTPADSWSPIEPLTHAGHEVKPEPGRTDGAEPRDRIDFIFARGLEVVDSLMRGCSVDGLVEDGFVDVGGRCELIP